jgi:glutamate-1-semialdehyde 2,1-aminomutase
MGDDLDSSEGIPIMEWRNLNLVAPSGDMVVLSEMFASYANEIAAVILEPCLINSGGASLTADFLRAVQTLCEKWGAILIFDEVITGFRAGIGGYQQLVGVHPDITVLGKALGGGAVPIAAVLGSRALLSLCSDHRVVHAGTFNGNPASVCAAMATLRLLTSPGTLSLDSLLQAGNSLKSSVSREIVRRGLPMQVSGLPGAIWLHPTDFNQQSRGDAWNAYSRLQASLLKSNILPAVPSRLYVTAGMTDYDIAKCILGIIEALQRYCEESHNRPRLLDGDS